MKLIDFLISVLQAHGQTLQRLAALFGEEEILEILELAGDSSDDKNQNTTNEFQLLSEWLEPPSTITHRSAYAEIEGAVREMKLPAVLEFHLWTYPFYRVLIESPFDLRSKIQVKDDQLVRAALEGARTWAKQLPIHPAHSRQAELAAHAPWIRFRTKTLKKLGQRPIEII